MGAAPRLEWRLADQRTYLMGKARTYLLPVCIDTTAEPDADVPDSFAAVQWTRLPGGSTSPAFVQRLLALIQPPTPASIGSPPDMPVTNATAPVHSATVEKSIAVLPFTNMSTDKEQEYFSDGLAEELINLLAKIPELRVPARSSSFFFKGKAERLATIAKELGVVHILEGSVRKSGNRLRVTTQLVRADSGYHLWSETFDRELHDVFAVQDEIAGAVVAALKLKLTPELQAARSHRTQNAEAYNLYLLGRQFFNHDSAEGFRRAAECYRKAIALDPGYSSAYAELAMANAWVADFENSPARRQQAIADADRAVALAPDQGDGYAARSFMSVMFRWDWSSAEADLHKALALDPADAQVQVRYAELLAALGRLPEAIVAARRATELDPLATRPWRRLGHYLYHDGQLNAGREALNRALEISPEAALALMSLGSLELAEGKPAVALALYRKIPDRVYQLTGIAIAEHALGHVRESQQAVDELIATDSEGSAYQIAQAYSRRGEPELAFEWLERAYAQHDSGLSAMLYDTHVGALRADPRFGAMLVKLNLRR